jgi:hypothetical protein
MEGLGVIGGWNSGVEQVNKFKSGLVHGPSKLASKDRDEPSCLFDIGL